VRLVGHVNEMGQSAGRRPYHPSDLLVFSPGYCHSGTTVTAETIAPLRKVRHSSGVLELAADTARA
jgi:hypothetical protein